MLTLAHAAAVLLDRYVELANSGDCGNWDPEKEAEVKRLRKALEPYKENLHKPSGGMIGETFFFTGDPEQKPWRIVEVIGDPDMYAVSSNDPDKILRLDRKAYITYLED